MHAWMFVALLWFDGGASWPDIIWSFTYPTRAACERASHASAQEYSQRPKVSYIMLSECFRWTLYPKVEV